jgi:mannose-6-phosphate isomerase-like protein (cupin superfamily)
MKLKISQLERHPKAWGKELWIHNGDGYCGKILAFHQGAKFSLHAHLKVESWMVFSGKLKLIYIDTDNADRHELILNKWDVVHIPSLVPHQLIALERSEIFEVSQEHDENGSFRYEKGDSQRPN